jgi:hypothetical protein
MISAGDTQRKGSATLSMSFRSVAIRAIIRPRQRSLKLSHYLTFFRRDDGASMPIGYCKLICTENDEDRGPAARALSAAR